MQPSTQRGDLRDKVAVTDPAAAPPHGDAEASGTATPAHVAAAADHEQAQAAQRAVPRLDASRAVSTHEHPGERHFGFLGTIASVAVAILVLVGAALYLTHGG